MTAFREDYPVVRTTSGPIRGFEQDGVLQFRGVPYAVAKRFCAPETVPAWNEVRDCYVFGDICPCSYIPLSTMFCTHRQWRMSENCLNLNIWTSGLTGKKAVMVWFHGGGFFSGSAIDEDLTDGDQLAGTGEVVVVTVNHRLNALGFTDLTAHGYPDSANAGLLDLIAALKWVRDNIASFGGDPGNVTIFGQSGGGGKVLSLMQMPAADGLFHKAIIQSGAIANTDVSRQPMSRNVTEEMMRAAGVSSAEELATMPYDALMAAAEAAAEKLHIHMMGYFAPHPDNVTLLDDYKTTGFRRETAKIPMMIGSNIAEFGYFGMDGARKGWFSKAELESLSYDEKLKKQEAFFGEKTAEIAEAAKAAYPWLDPLYYPYIDAMFRSEAIECIRRRATMAEAPIYAYMLAYVVPALEGKLCWHGAEFSFTFGTLERSQIMQCGGKTAERLKIEMRDAWIAFAKTGDPNHVAMPEWKPSRSGECMVFADETYYAENHDEKLMACMPRQEGF